MAKPKYDPEFLQLACDLYHEVGKNKAELGRRLNRPRATCQHLVNRFELLKLTPRGSPPNTGTDAQALLIEGLRKELDTLREALTKSVKPHFTIRQDNAGRSSKIRVVCIGDGHDDPRLPDKSRFRWIGQYIRETKPDIVVQIGDFLTLDSLNGHIGNETYEGKSKPSFMADMVSFNDALDAMQIDGIERHCTLGNHERRLYLFENRAPEAYGMMQCELQKIFERHGWTFSPYGMPHQIGGVSFVHCALNTLGKAYGGKNSEGTIANDAIGDWVIGHSHRERMHRAAKLGGNNYVKIINVGCALPDGHIEEYARHTLTGWSYGISDMTIQHGHVQDYHFVSMNHLGECYGKV